MGFFKALQPPKFALPHVITEFTCYRDAVIWCWENRQNTGAGEKVDQALCANFLGLPTSHMSRCLNREAKAPMNLNPDLVADFEAFTGWKAITQFIASKAQVTFIEEMQALLAQRNQPRAAACA